MYTVKEASKLTGISEHTIRYYTNRELVPVIRRDSNNKRLFNDNAILWLNFVKRFRDMGIPIDAIREYCTLCSGNAEDIERCKQIITEQRVVAEAEYKEAKKRLANIKKMEQQVTRGILYDNT